MAQPIIPTSKNKREFFYYTIENIIKDKIRYNY